LTAVYRHPSAILVPTGSITDVGLPTESLTKKGERVRIDQFLESIE